MTDVRGARLVRMLADPELGGDLLLVGMAMAGWLDFGSGRSKFNIVGSDLWPTDPSPGHRLRRVVAEDARTYKPPAPHWTCTFELRNGTGTCGRSSGGRNYITDWATGEQTWIGGCRTHTNWVERTIRQNRDARPGNPPRPMANHGGVLARHFPKVNWPLFWTKCDPNWVRHPEKHPWPKPTLEVIVGDGDDIDLDTQRPLLTLIETA